MAMRVAVGQHAQPSDEYLTFARQVGVAGVQFNTPDLPGERCWEQKDVRRLVERVAGFDLRVEAIENIPPAFYDKVMLGQDGRDEQINNVSTTIRAIGRAGIPVLGLCFMPQSVWRTALLPRGRGGAVVSGYDHAVANDPGRLDEVWVARRDQRRADVKDTWVRGSHIVTGVRVSEDEMWANLAYFLRAIIPVAEEVGVRIALHPDDPPVPELGGIARILRSVEALDRAMSIHPSDALGLDLCLGTVSEMGGRDAVLSAIDRFGPSGKIVYVHLRDVRGQAPVFEECFLGEGNYQPFEIVERLHAVGFNGFILDDHTPGLVNDDGYGYRGRAHAIGYIQALIEAVRERKGSPC